jgi:peptidase S46-like protein
MRSTRVTVCFILLAGCAGAASAEEGMWMPQQIPALADRLRALGFEGDAQSFADLTGQPMGAIVSLGGCSASFVSADGLIVTNNHCVQNALQYNSTPDHNFLADGFIARKREDEMSNGPGSRLSVVTQVVEVTDDLKRRLTPALTDRKRYDVVDAWTKERTAACEKDGSRCRVAPFFGGLRWFEIKQVELMDVRLVYAPAKGIGNFGGETDNWRWPRHTGDFSFYRAYVGPDGKPAPYSVKNLPYRPKRWLKISPKGASPGELVFVVGYPGMTERLQTAGEITELASWGLPRSIRRATEQLAILDGLKHVGPDVPIKIQNRIRGLNNGLTKNRGVLDGLVKGGILEKKLAQQRELSLWISENPERRMRFADVLAELHALQDEAAKTRECDAIVTDLRGARGADTLLGAAIAIVDTAFNRPKKDVDREPEFQERNWSRNRDGLERMQKTLDRDVDRALLRYRLLEAAQLPASERIEPLDRAAGLAAGMSPADAARAIDAFLDRLYAGTKLFDKDIRLAALGKSSKELSAAGDPFLDLAAALLPLRQQLREKVKTRDGARYRLIPRYMTALLEKSGGLVAPDANGTLRVTYGRVLGVDSKDGLAFKPQTTLSGIVEKQTGQGDFDAPRRELEAIESVRLGRDTPYLDPALHDVPVNFLSTVDTTGGNSGSATLNARGELTGLLFDGTYDTVASDILYDPVHTRSIHVDSRYLLWVLTEVDGATSLLEELGR